jgi:hypothetical protein
MDIILRACYRRVSLRLLVVVSDGRLILVLSARAVSRLMPVLSPVLTGMVSIVPPFILPALSPIVVVSAFVSLVFPELLHAIRLITMAAVAKTFFILLLFLWLTNIREQAQLPCHPQSNKNVRLIYYSHAYPG